MDIFKPVSVDDGRFTITYDPPGEFMTFSAFALWYRDSFVEWFKSIEDAELRAQEMLSQPTPEDQHFMAFIDKRREKELS